MATIFTLSVTPAKFGGSTSTRVGKGWYVNKGDNFGFKEGTIKKVVDYKRPGITSSFGFKSRVWHVGRMPIGRTIVGQIREVNKPPELVSVQTRTYLLTSTVLRVFPFIDRTNATLTGTNTMGWLYSELEPMVACVVRLDWNDVNATTLEFMVRHDGADSSVINPTIAAAYVANGEAPLNNDVTAPGWFPVSAVNPVFVRGDDLYRLRAFAPLGAGSVVTMTVEILARGRALTPKA